MALISVVVPVYNAEKTIIRCIDSIINQTFKDFELILINDGSKDKSGAICDEYAENDDRVVVVHKINEGVSIARNVGIQRANSKYIIFVDSDDYINYRMLELLLSKIEDSSYSAVMCGYTRSFVYKGKEVRKKNVLPDVNNLDTIDLYKENWSKLYSKSLFNAPWGKLYKLSDIKEWNICFNPDISCGEDLLFNLDVFRKIFKIAIVNEPLYVYECTEKESLTNKYTPDKDRNDKLLFNLTINYLKEMEMLGHGQDSVSLIYMRSCFITFEHTLLLKNELSFKERKSYINSIINCNDTVEALHSNTSHTRESWIYSLVLKTKSYVIVSFFTRLRYSFKKMLRKGLMF